MSQYRKAVQDGVLVRQKRGLLRFWMWFYNRCEEDHLTKLKNRLVLVKDEMRRLQRAIPKVQAEVDAEKKRLLDMGGHNHPYRDSWAPRRERVRLLEPGELKKRKTSAADARKTKRAAPILELRQPGT